jgi:hypothetical protein
MGLPNYAFCLDETSTRAWYRDSDGKRYDCVNASDCVKATCEVTCWCDPAACAPCNR